MTAAAIPSRPRLSERSWVWSLGPFMVMCVGMFIALLDIQIVASSLQDIGGGLQRGAGSDQLGADRLSDRRDHHDPAVGLADPRVLDPLAVHRFRRRLHRREHAVRARLEHRKHDRVPRASGHAGRVDDPDRLHLDLSLFPGSAARLFGRRGRRHRLGRADARTRHRRLHHRHTGLALAFLHQRRARHGHIDPGAPPREDRQAGSLVAQGRRLSRHHPLGDDARDPGICARGRVAVELVRRCDHS